MGTRKKILSLLLMIVLLLPVGMGIHVEAAAETKQVDVLFTHDTHSHLNSFSTIVDGGAKGSRRICQNKNADRREEEGKSGYTCAGWRRFFNGNADSDGL